MAGFIPDYRDVRIQEPMLDLIMRLPVAGGLPISQGDVLVILESIKMDNELSAPCDGTPARLYVGIGDSVEGKQILATLV